MKKFFVLTITLLIVFSLVACTAQEDISDTSKETGNSADQGNITMLEDGVWPDNEYTEGLPIPDGTVAWVMLDSENAYCSINIEDMSQAEYDKYIQALADLGFVEVESVSEEIEGEDYVSVGTIFSDGEKSLSIAYADENFGIYIVKESN